MCIKIKTYVLKCYYNYTDIKKMPPEQTCCMNRCVCIILNILYGTCVARYFCTQVLNYA